MSLKNKKRKKKISFPRNCPSCNKLLKKKNKKAYCLNINCKAKILERIKHFLSKNAMNIKINKKIIKKLFKEKKIKKIIDFYSLKINDLINLKISKKEANRIIQEIKNSKNQSFSNILFALSIPNIGKYLSKKIGEKYNNILTLIKDIKKEKINYIGKKNLDNIKIFFKQNLKIIKKLKKIGCNL
ncbi:MAG: hypothetical protein NHG13_00700 [Candidatus Shikimatogenerans bostrichidophilus]|nr:MAG: hypothetical protein NHG13_00700 [Candidatus Shikimatogenerans bostrichidophilus]